MQQGMQKNLDVEEGLYTQNDQSCGDQFSKFMISVSSVYCRSLTHHGL